MFAARRMHRFARHDRHEARAPIGMEEAALGEEASACLAARSRRPHERRQRRVALIVETGTSADVEIARAVILEGRQRGMLAENIGDALPGEGLAEAET